MTHSNNVCWPGSIGSRQSGKSRAQAMICRAYGERVAAAGFGAGPKTIAIMAGSTYLALELSLRYSPIECPLQFSTPMVAIGFNFYRPSAVRKLTIFASHPPASTRLTLTLSPEKSSCEDVIFAGPHRAGTIFEFGVDLASGRDRHD